MSLAGENQLLGDQKPFVAYASNLLKYFLDLNVNARIGVRSGKLVQDGFFWHRENTSNRINMT